MDSEIHFTEEEISQELANLGYYDVPIERLKQFQKDLEQLVTIDKSSSSNRSAASEKFTLNDTELNKGSSLNLVKSSSTQNDNKQTNSNAGHSKFHYIPTTVSSSNQGERLKPTVCIPSVSFLSNDSSINDSPQANQRPISAPALGDSKPYSANVTDSSINESSSKKYLKRKTLRKHKNGESIIDESLTESEDFENLQEQLEKLPIYYYQVPPKARNVPSRPVSSQSEPAYRLPDDFNGLKALIKPMPVNPHMRGVIRSDPVTRYQQYSSSWHSQKAPGEKSHKDLRWNVREHMLQHDQIINKKQSKSFVPNDYVIPSDKQRKSLRWQIRNDMASGIVPPPLL